MIRDGQWKKLEFYKTTGSLSSEIGSEETLSRAFQRIYFQEKFGIDNFYPGGLQEFAVISY